MSISDNALEQMLFENESPTLDFKRDQYAFEGAPDTDKCELLKDILFHGSNLVSAFMLIFVETSCCHGESIRPYR